MSASFFFGAYEMVVTAKLFWRNGRPSHVVPTRHDAMGREAAASASLGHKRTGWMCSRTLLGEADGMVMPSLPDTLSVLTLVRCWVGT